MNGDELRAWRKRQQPAMTQGGLASLLSQTFGRRYDANGVGKWERGDRPIPAAVAEFMTQLALEQTFPSADPPLEPAGDSYELPPDEMPPPDDSVPPPPAGSDEKPMPALLPSSNAYTRACEELWEGIAAIVGSVGAVTGNEATVQDGRIILAHKERLGAAWGHLAEKNETVRRWLTAGAISGAWIEVTIATAVMGNQLIDNHRAYAAARRAEREGGDSGNSAAGHAAFTVVS